jgi:hypothetical protein
MIVFLLIAGLIGFSGYTVQEKHDYCESIKFEAGYCKDMKKMDELGK